MHSTQLECYTWGGRPSLPLPALPQPTLPPRERKPVPRAAAQQGEAQRVLPDHPAGTGQRPSWWGGGRASERQGVKANEAVIMLKTIMALLWELLK